METKSYSGSWHTDKFFGSTFIVRIIYNNYRMERKQYSFNKDFIHPLSIDMFVLAIKRATKMAEIKIGIMLAYLIGVPLWLFAFIANLDSWKSAALFIMMMIYWMGMIWFGFRRKRRIEKKEEMELRKQEIELWYAQQEKLKVEAKTVK